jgi:putative membrane-bound dehydrogenase-like protein
MKKPSRAHINKPFKIALALFLSICLFFQGTSFSEDKKKAEKKVDFASELPRILPKSPEESLKAIKIHPDFEIQLVAAEPLVRDPVAMCFDENGRAYVVELPEYNDAKGEGYSTVKLLEDRNGDGVFDKSYPFLYNVTLPTAVFCYKGGVFIGAPPYLYYCKDTNGNGIADIKETIMTGFGRDKGDEGMINSFRWGLDNKIHFSTGTDGGVITLNADPKKKKYNTRRRGIIFDPETRTIELTTGGGQHGFGMDDWNRYYVCGNSRPMQILMYDDRYISRNPYLAPPSAVVSIAPGGKFTKLFRISQSEPWRIVRSRLRAQSDKGDYEHGKPSGYFTAATGINIYRGNAWPEKYKDDVFVGEAANNLVFRATPKPKGLGLTAPRSDKEVEFIASEDVWFRPVQLENGPDGNLYVLDMYRELIEGAPFIPEDIIKHLNPVGGQELGRIYRIVPKGSKQSKRPLLGLATTTELVELLESDNGWTRDTAQRLLFERQDKQAVKPLKSIARNSKKPITRATALWTLKGLGALNENLILSRLQDNNPHVRIQALRVSESYAMDSKAIQKEIIKLSQDSSLVVQYQVAFSLGSFQSKERNKAFTNLLSSNMRNPWIFMAVQSSLNYGAGEILTNVVNNPTLIKNNRSKILLSALATQIGAQGREKEIKQFLAANNILQTNDKNLSQQLFKNFLSRASGNTKSILAKSGNDQTTQQMKNIVQSAIKISLNTKMNIKNRVAAINSLDLGSFSDTEETFEELLSVQQPLEIRKTTLIALNKLNNADVASLIIESWPSMSPKLRASAVETLTSRENWLLAMLTAIKNEDINPGDISPERIQLLKAHKNKNIQKQAIELFLKQQLTGRSEVVKAYKVVLKMKGNATNGKAIFKKNCSSCHQLEKVGIQLGADLKAIKDRGTEAILLNILDPNREVKPQFVTYTLATTKGRTVSGLIKEENANSITIAKTDGTTDTILRIDIDELISSKLSFMPEGLEKEIDKQAMADLLAYLNSTK